MWNEIKSVYWRVVGAMRLDPRVFAEIHADPRATYQAVVVVYVTALAVSVRVPGGWITTFAVPLGFLAWWFVVAFIVHWLGTTFFREGDMPPTTLAPLARGIGYAMAPRILQIFLIIVELPFPMGRLIQFLSIGWIFAAMTVSTHIALGRMSYTRVAIIIGIAMLPVILLEPFILGLG